MTSIDGINISRRTMLAGSVTALALTLPASAMEPSRATLPGIVQVSWGGEEAGPASRERLIAAITGTVQASMSKATAAATWVLVDA